MNRKLFDQRQDTVRALLTLLVGLGLSAALGFAARVIVARNLTLDEFGSFSAAIAILTILGPIAVFGASDLWLQRFGSDPATAPQWLYPTFALVSVSTGVALVIGSVVAFAPGIDRTTGEFILILLPLVVLGALVQLTTAIAQIDRRNGQVALRRTLVRGSHFIGAGASFLIGAGARGTAVSIAVPAVLVSLWLLARVRAFSRRFSSRRRKAIGLWTVAGRSAPYLLGSMSFVLYFHSDIWLVEWIKGPSEAGWYSSAVTFLMLAYLLPTALFQLYLQPRQHVWHRNDPAVLMDVYGRTTRLMIPAGLAVAAGLALASTPLVSGVFGGSYRNARGVLLILVAAVPLRFASSPAGSVMNTEPYVRLKTRILLMAGLFNVASNLVLIPILGMHGAAYATVATEGLVLFAFSRVLQRNGFRIRR